jgi:hypothetical protein
MPMKQFFIYLLYSFFTSVGFSQNISLPPVSSLKTQQDLERTKPDLIKAANWLEQTPINGNPEKRKEVERFVFMWVSASNTINVEMNRKILGFDDHNPGLAMIYTASAAKYLVQKNSTDRLQSQIAGLKSVVAVYKRGIGIKKDKNLDALVQADRKGRLKKWLSS